VAGPSELTECPACRRVTVTIAGRCPHCWSPKAPAAAPPARRWSGPSAWDDDDALDGLLGLLSWAPGLALLVLGLLLDSPPLLVIAVGVLGLRLAGGQIAGWW
jgi:hypothetical protein